VPGPPLDVSALVVFVMVPMMVAMTLTVKLQLEFAGADPPDKPMLSLPAIAVTVPPHPLTKPFGARRPAGVSMPSRRAAATVPMSATVADHLRRRRVVGSVQATRPAAVSSSSDC
jgi:hypothetical protein